MNFKKQKDYLIDNALLVFFSGMVIGLSDNLLGRISILGFIIMLISFYFMYLKSKKKLTIPVPFILIYRPFNDLEEFYILAT